MTKTLLLTVILSLCSAIGNAQGIIDLTNSDVSLEDAIKQAREWRRLNDPQAKGGIDIYLGDRTYSLTKPIFLRPEDSGTASSPTRIHGGRISGGVKVGGWHKIDAASLPDGSPLKAIAKTHTIYQADAPLSANRIIYTRQLWVNGSKALRAQQFGEGKMERMIDFNTADRTITIPTPAIDLQQAGQLEMLVHQRWAIAILRVKALKTVGKNTIVTFHDPESQLEFAHPWPQPVIGGERGNSSFCLMNALELLDEPGEWYQDYPSGKIYYYPRQGEDMAKADIEIPALETLVNIEGSNERNVSHIVFDGTTFEYAAWSRPSVEGHVTLQGGFRMIDAYKLHKEGLFHNATLENQAWIARPETAVRTAYAHDITFRNCTFSHLAATALDLEAYVNASSVSGCRFQDIGGNALMVGYFAEHGFETHIPYAGSNICDSISITRNTITDATNEDWGAVGIAAGYVRNIDISDNHLSRLNYSGICVGWGWTPLESGMRGNRICRNTVSDYARQLYDAGGIYTLSNQPGSLITDNIISAPFPAPYATNERAFCIYFDACTDGFTVERNKMVFGSYGYNNPGPALIIKDNK